MCKTIDVQKNEKKKKNSVLGEKKNSVLGHWESSVHLRNTN